MWGFWLIASGIFIIIEIFTTGFLIFWLGLASLFAMITSFFTTNLIIQTLVFVIFSIIFMIFTRPLVNKFTKNKELIPTNIYSIIGKTGIVLENINTLDGAGKVKISGELWSAISDTPLNKGTKIKVTQVDGVKLKVESLENKVSLN